MAFHDDAIFPANIAIDSTFGWGFQTSILTSTTGAEQRVARREQVLHTGDVGTGIQDPEQLLELKAFHLARRGALYGFRFKDPLDHLSTDADPCDPATVVSDTDVTLGAGDGTTTQFQLIKTYSSLGNTYTRTITKPIDGTVVIAVGGVSQGASDFSVDYSTGMVTFDSGSIPASGQDVTAGFEFHTPVRFDADADKALEVAFEEFKYGRIPRIGITEILEGGIAQEDTWYGGSYVYEGSADVQLSTQQGRYNKIGTGTTAPTLVLLPEANSMAEGGPHFFIHNASTTTFDIVDKSGTVLIDDAAAGSLHQAWVYYNASAATNVWVLGSA